MKAQIYKKLEAVKVNQEACCAQPIDGSDCCDKSAGNTPKNACCAQPAGTSVCC